MGTIHSIKRTAGIAGQYGYVVSVQYPDDDKPETVTLTSSTYGPPVVLSTGSGMQVFVSESVLDRLGRKLDEAWVRAFFSDAQEA